MDQLGNKQDNLPAKYKSKTFLNYFDIMIYCFYMFLFVCLSKSNKTQPCNKNKTCLNSNPRPHCLIIKKYIYGLELFIIYYNYSTHFYTV